MLRVHSDFYEPRGVVIEKYPDRIILQNPGTIIVGKKQILKGGLSEPRNGTLMKMFHQIGYWERAGSGVSDIFAAWKDAGLAEPTMEEKFGSCCSNRTIVMLPLVPAPQPEKQPEKQPDSQPEKQHENQHDQRVNAEQKSEKNLLLMQETPSISIKELSKQLGLSLQQVRTAIEEMSNKKPYSS